MIFFLVVLTLQACVAEIVVMGPETLKQQFASTNYTISVSFANFGYIPYGQFMMGQL